MWHLAHRRGLTRLLPNNAEGSSHRRYLAMVMVNKRGGVQSTTQRKSDLLLYPTIATNAGSSAGRMLMSDKAFLDTNILIYFYSEDDERKRNAAYTALNSHDVRDERSGNERIKQHLV